MNAQVGVAGESSEPLDQGSIPIGSLPASPTADEVSDDDEVVSDDESRIEDWFEEGGAFRG